VSDNGVACLVNRECALVGIKSSADIVHADTLADSQAARSVGVRLSTKVSVSNL
jgi:hypothetical protein